MQPSIKVENQNMILESNRILSWLKKVHVVHIIRSLKQQDFIPIHGILFVKEARWFTSLWLLYNQPHYLHQEQISWVG